MNNLFDNWRKSGVTQNQALSYAAWLNMNTPEMSLKFKFWTPTPLPIGYLGKDNQLVRLPFLDTRYKSRVFGIMVGNACFSKIFLCERYELCSDARGSHYKVYCDNGDIWRNGLIDTNAKLQSLRMYLYPIQGSAMSVFLCESKYARSPFLPNLNQIQQAYLLKDAFDDTLQILSQADIEVNTWNNKSIICCNDCTKDEDKREYMAVDFSSGFVKNYADAEKKDDTFFTRAVLPIGKYDPPYPVDKQGCFDWIVWEKYCAPCFK